jgi:hypothetical protein
MQAVTTIRHSHSVDMLECPTARFHAVVGNAAIEWRLAPRHDGPESVGLTAAAT